MVFIGVDLAWGDRKRDGVCVIEASRANARVLSYHYPLGDDEFLNVMRDVCSTRKGIFTTIDAPIVCPNLTGTRPVDRLTHRMFHREHAACHPANRTKCARPFRILDKLAGQLGFEAGWKPSSVKRVAAEVYPHPAMVRFFELDRIIKYKKSPIQNRRREFKRLQRCMQVCIEKYFPTLELDDLTPALLKKTWNKETEDHLDGLFCALIGLWHWMHGARRSEVIGDLETGFILLPRLK